MTNFEKFKAGKIFQMPYDTGKFGRVYQYRPETNPKISESGCIVSAACAGGHVNHHCNISKLAAKSMDIYKPFFGKIFRMSVPYEQMIFID